MSHINKTIAHLEREIETRTKLIAQTQDKIRALNGLIDDLRQFCVGEIHEAPNPKSHANAGRKPATNGHAAPPKQRKVQTRCGKCGMTLRACKCAAVLKVVAPAKPSAEMGITDMIRAVLPEVSKNGSFWAADVRQALQRKFNAHQDKLIQVSSLLLQISMTGELVKTGTGRNSVYQLPGKHQAARTDGISVPRDFDS
jgi:hypothetical protein